MIQDGNRRSCHGPSDWGSKGSTAGELSRRARRARISVRPVGCWRSLRCLMALAGGSRQDGGMDRQTLRDWVIRFNEQGPDGLINLPSPGRRQARQGAPRLSGADRGGRADPGRPWRGAMAGLRSDHAAARGVRHLGVGRYGLSCSQGPRLLTRQRPAQSLQQDPEAIEAFKKTSPPAWRKPQQPCARHAGRGVVSGRDAGRAEKQAHLSLGQKGIAAAGRPRSTHPIDLPVRCRVP